MPCEAENTEEMEKTPLFGGVVFVGPVLNSLHGY